MDITIPGYTITGVLGKGGMGSVYLAVQESLKRQVALKIMAPALLADPTFGERFLREAKINSRLMHHNIVTVYDVGVYDSHHYLAMEYIPGVDLRKKKYDLSLAQSLDVITQIASALNFASRKGYVHRDVKPENIMLHEEDERAVLMDFGIARAADSSTSMTMTGTALGTPRYMSPEQAQGESVDGRSDVYSLGVVLFVMLTGHVPFDADSSVAIGIKHITEAVPRLPPMYEAFQGIIDKVLAKSADDRYQNGQEFKRAIEALSDDVIAEISAKRDSEGFASDADTQASSDIESTIVDTGAATVVSGAQFVDGLEAVEDVDLDATRLSASGAMRVAGSTDIPVTSAPIGLVPNIEDRSQVEAAKPVKSKLPLVLASVSVLAVGGYFLLTDSPQPVVIKEPTTTEVPVVTVPKPAPTTDSESGQEGQDAGAKPDFKDTEIAQAPEVAVSVEVGSDVKSVASVRAPAIPVSKQEQLAIALAAVEVNMASLGSNFESFVTMASTLESARLVDEYQGRAEIALAAMQSHHEDSIESALNAGRVERANEYLVSLRQLFPGNRRIGELDILVQQQSGLVNTLALARKYLRANALTQPAGANAFDAYQKILKQYPDNKDAKQGLQRIAARYSSLAKARFEQQDWPAATSFAKRGLAIDSSRQDLRVLLDDIVVIESNLQQVEQLLARGAELVGQGALILPEQDNAIAVLQQALPLAQSKDDVKARIAELQLVLESELRATVEAGNSADVRDKLNAAVAAFPNSDELQQLALLAVKAETESVPEAEPEIVVPAPVPTSTIALIDKILVSGDILSDLALEQLSPITVDRTIHIGFHFANLKEEATVVQAVLYDGARTIELAQVPVVVIGKEGEKFFRIDKPVEGFADGGYSIDFVVGDDVLSTLKFSVE